MLEKEKRTCTLGIARFIYIIAQTAANTKHKKLHCENEKQILIGVLTF